MIAAGENRTCDGQIIWALRMLAKSSEAIPAEIDNKRRSQHLWLIAKSSNMDLPQPDNRTERGNNRPQNPRRSQPPPHSEGEPNPDTTRMIGAAASVANAESAAIAAITESLELDPTQSEDLSERNNRRNKALRRPHDSTLSERQPPVETKNATRGTCGDACRTHL